MFYFKIETSGFLQRQSVGALINENFYINGLELSVGNVSIKFSITFLGPFFHFGTFEIKSNQNWALSFSINSLIENSFFGFLKKVK